MGAWIEIWMRWNIFGTDIVAPHMGAWIEIKKVQGNSGLEPVAPHMGAWIEICQGVFIAWF